jgi:hypothetical protein
MKPIITIHNIETGQVIEREMNEAELAQLANDQAEAQIEKDKETARQEARQIILTRLGISAEEAALLLL